MAGVLRVKVGGEWIDVGVGGSGADEKVPAGSVFSTIAVAAPAGYLILNGATITNGQSLYPNLWAVIPAAWKSGTSIVLPDARGRAIVGAGTGSGLTNRPLASASGAESHTLSTAELAAHAHVHNACDIGTTDWANTDHTHTAASGGAFWSKGGSGGVNFGAVPSTGSTDRTQLTTSGFSTNHYHDIAPFTTTEQNTGGGTAHNNMQPYLALNWIIKT